MSRSYQHQPVFAITGAASEKKDKQAWHRRWRHTERHVWQQAWRTGQENEHVGVPHQAVSSRRRMAKEYRSWTDGWIRWCHETGFNARRRWEARLWGK